jgi:hypothetical protein
MSTWVLYRISDGETQLCPLGSKILPSAVPIWKCDAKNFASALKKKEKWTKKKSWRSIIEREAIEL